MEKEEKNNKTQEAAPGISAKQLALFIKEQTKLDWPEIVELLLQLQADELDFLETKLAEMPDHIAVPKPLQLITACVQELGWGFILEKDKDNMDLNGFIIGNPEFLDKIAKKLKGANDKSTDQAGKSE